MAPRKKNRAAQPARKIAARRVRNRRRGADQRTPLGSLILKGVNAILSAVPATKLFNPICDFLFKSFGFSIPDPKVADLPSVSATVALYGLGAAFAVPLSTIIENAPILAKHHSGYKTQLYTNFTHGQLMQIRVTVKPSGELAHRQGNMALAFIPYTTSESGRYYDVNTDIPTLQDVLLVPGAVQGSGTRTLSVNYRCRGPQLFCAQPHPLTTEIGLVLISYEDLSRNKGTQFEAEDFGAEVIISGTVKLSNPLPHVGYSAVNCNVRDKLASKTVRIGNYTVLNGECVNKDDRVIVTGHFVQSTFAQDGVRKEELGPHQPEGSPLSMVSMLDAALEA